MARTTGMLRSAHSIAALALAGELHVLDVAGDGRSVGLGAIRAPGSPASHERFLS
jgi:hypothetical protein